jgi:sec-independent protein translocase protein TatB
VFDIAWTEILLIAVIAILVVGPKELPGMLRAFGKTFGQVRRTARDFQNTFNDALREAERQAKLDEVKKDLDSVRSIDPTADLRKGLDETKKSLDGKVDDKAAPKPDVVPLKGDRPAATAQEKPAEPASPQETDGESSGEQPRAAAGGERR